MGHTAEQLLHALAGRLWQHTRNRCSNIHYSFWWPQLSSVVNLGSVVGMGEWILTNHCCIFHALPYCTWGRCHSYTIVSAVSLYVTNFCGYTHTHLTALFPGLPRWAGTRKVKPIWILLKQETVSGSEISCWAICKSAPCSRQTTTPASHHSVFYTPDALPAAQPTVSKHWRHSLTLQPVVQPVIQPVAWRVVTCRNRQFSETSSTANHDYEGGKRSSLTPVLTGRHQGRVRVNTGILVFDWMIHLPLLHAAARHVPWSFTLS